MEQNGFVSAFEKWLTVNLEGNRIWSSGCDTVAPGPRLALACFCIALEPGRVFPFLNVVKKRKEDSRWPAKPGVLGSGPWEKSPAGRASGRRGGWGGRAGGSRVRHQGEEEAELRGMKASSGFFAKASGGDNSWLPDRKREEAGTRTSRRGRCPRPHADRTGNAGHVPGSHWRKHR